MTKKILITLLIIIVVALGLWLLFAKQPADVNGPTGDGPLEFSPEASTPPQESALPGDQSQTTVGQSVEGRAITAYHYGNGSDEILFIGGIHGGYEWNTVQLAYEAMDYFEANPNVIPTNVRVTVIPVMNPDGLYDIAGTAGRVTKDDVPASLSETIPGRFNANEVDLGRNFDCEWQANAVWQSRQVSGGSAPFSEPESGAIRDYVQSRQPAAIVTWYSAAGGVFASSCNNGVSAETKAITDAYAKAAGYPSYESFDFYAITGDMVNWFAKENIPAISVLLTNHTDTEWTKNQAGIDALLKYYAK